MSKLELRMAGSGGQGIILASIIIAEAAFLDKKNVSQSQSYGPEARGGRCKAEVVIDENPIKYTKVQVPNFLLALTQESLEQYAKGIAKDAVVMIDADLTAPESVKDKKVVKIPILSTAKNEIGRAMTANIIAVGAINKAMNIASEESLRRAVLMHVPKGTEELNMKALDAGIRMAS